MQDQLFIAKVLPCDCLDHVRVQLEPCDAFSGSARTVRVDAGIGHGILAELNGVPSAHAIFIDLLETVVTAFGARMNHISIDPEHEPPAGWIHFGGQKAQGALGRLPAGVALLVATRLRLPIALRVGDPAPAVREEVPAGVREFVESLDLDWIFDAGESRGH